MQDGRNSQQILLTVSAADPHTSDPIPVPDTAVQPARRLASLHNHTSAALALASYLVVSLAGLLALRAFVKHFEFVGVGWLLLLAIIPCLPFLLPRIGGFLRDVSPFVKGVKVGMVKVDFRSVSSSGISLPSSGVFASIPNDLNSLSQGTTIAELLKGITQLRRDGGSPVVVIDLRAGEKWRLPNLYFVARILEREPVVSQLLFTENQSGTDGFFVGTCRPRDFSQQVERTLSAYGDASKRLEFRPNELNSAEEAGTYAELFKELNLSLGSSTPDTNQLRAYVNSGTIRHLASGLLSTVTVESPGTTLNSTQVIQAIDSPYRYVPATSQGRLNSLIDRDLVALSVARATAKSN